MTDQNNADAFNEDVTRFAENNRQNAMAKAEADFTLARRAILDEWTAKVQAVRAKWDQLRSDPSDPDHDAAKDAFDRLQQAGGPNYGPAYAQRDRAVQAADREYQTTVAALRAKHGVVDPQHVGRR
jgi:hypothetical protein